MFGGAAFADSDTTGNPGEGQQFCSNPNNNYQTKNPGAFMKAVMEGSQHYATWSATSKSPSFAKYLAEMFNGAALDGAASWTAITRIKVKPQVLRHTFCTTLLNAHGPMNTVSGALGHADASSTINTYAKYMADSHDAVPAALEAIMGHA